MRITTKTSGAFAWIGNLFRKFYGQDHDWLDEGSHRVPVLGLVIVYPYQAFTVERVYFEDGALQVVATTKWESTDPLTILPGSEYVVVGVDSIEVYGASLDLPDGPVTVKGPGAELTLTLPVGIVIQ